MPPVQLVVSWKTRANFVTEILPETGKVFVPSVPGFLLPPPACTMQKVPFFLPNAGMHCAKSELGSSLSMCARCDLSRREGHV